MDTNMTNTEPTRIPTRFVFIRNLASPTSAHLNDKLARLGEWKPERQRWSVTPCDSENVNEYHNGVAVKEANIADATDDDVVGFVLERLNDASFDRVGFNARFGRLDFVLNTGRVVDDLPETLLAPLADATVRIIQHEATLEHLPKYCQYAAYFIIGPWFVYKAPWGRD